MSGSSAFSPVTRVLITIGKSHFTLAVPAPLNKVSYVATTIGLHHIPSTVPSVILVIPTIDITVAINRHTAALSPALEPVTHEVGIDSARLLAFEGAISVRVRRGVSLLPELPVWAPNERDLARIKASRT